MKTRSMLAVILAGSMMAAACTGCGGNAKDATGAISEQSPYCPVKMDPVPEAHL